jgi:2-amino-4-hydroxy-6-hydroxymethyldihydropteridine diphosphokinase
MIAYLGLGSNLGDRFRNLAEAVRRLSLTGTILITAVSSVYETDPVGDIDQPNYLNAALEIETPLSPKELLDVCLRIEKEMGRVRSGRWESRIIDIDVLFCGDEVISTKDLIVPHPLLHDRAFVLMPLAEIAPGLMHPMMNASIEELLEETDASGVRKMENMVLSV